MLREIEENWDQGEKIIFLCLRFDLGTFEPYIGKNIGRSPERVHFPTPAGVGGENGYCLAPNCLKSGGYTLAKKGVFWDPTCKGIFGGPGCLCMGGKDTKRRALVLRHHGKT